MQWLYLYFPSLQLDSLLNQQAYHQPCVLVDKNKVLQANPEARQWGIKIGTGLAQAVDQRSENKVLKQKL